MRDQNDKPDKPKLDKSRVCAWCGTGLRGRATCSRGPACGKEQANHEILMDRIAELRK